MRVLAIETSGLVGSVALLEAEGDRTIIAAERRTPEGERTARSLLPTIQELLREQQWRPADVHLVCVTTGPGSFTGLRIGVVTAKTFAYATGARLAGVHTLATIAAGVKPRGPARLWTVLDAQRQELFVACFDGNRLPIKPSPKQRFSRSPLGSTGSPPATSSPARRWRNAASNSLPGSLWPTNVFGNPAPQSSAH